jgi:class 3 adenylate cyclase
LFLIHATGSGSNLANASLARAGRAARAGTRAARVVRIFKLISIFVQKKREREAKKKQKEDFMERDTKIGILIADGISRKVILIVAAMIIGSTLINLIEDQDIFTGPVAEREFTSNLNNLELMLSISGGAISANPFRSSVVRFIDTINSNTDQVSTNLNKCPAGADYMTVRKSMNTVDCGLRYLRVNGAEIWGSYKDSYSELRVGANQETMFVTGMNKSSTTISTFMVLAQKDKPAKESAASTVTVTFIIVVLSVSTMLMNSDTEELIVNPIKEMCFSINSLIENPLAKLELDKGVVSAETQMIASSMMNLSGMLQVALGQAGITIIRNFLKGAGDPNQLTAQGGTRVQAIFAFCDIHHFSEQTVALQEDIMLLVNKVSVIVHTSAAENEGFINKNIGDCFLLAWRLPEFRSVNTKVTAADSALRSAIRTILEIKSDAELHQLTTRESVQQRVPGYRIKMGFGLHAGYGIEGAIGSSKKIDASYLSPNVNLASRLEYACKQYGLIYFICRLI